jgi:hypothetical protein
VAPPSGNLWAAGQQIWLGRAMTGQVIRICEFNGASCSSFSCDVVQGRAPT